MFVKIIKAHNAAIWYNGNIGKEKEIKNDTIYYHKANNNKKYFMTPSGRGIYCSDCEIINMYPTLSPKYKEAQKI